MSQENVEVVRRLFDAVARGDSASTLALYDVAVEIDAVPGTFMQELGIQMSRGHDGLRALNREMHEAFESFETPCEELIEAGDHVVSASRYRARGRKSGIVIEGPVQYGVWTVRAGKVIRVMWFDTREEALEAAGLGSD